MTERKGLTYEQALTQADGDLVLQVVSLARSLDMSRSPLLLDPFDARVEDLKDGGAGCLDGVGPARACCTRSPREGACADALEGRVHGIGTVGRHKRFTSSDTTLSFDSGRWGLCCRF